MCEDYSYNPLVWLLLNILVSAFTPGSQKLKFPSTPHLLASPLVKGNLLLKTHSCPFPDRVEAFKASA